MIMKDLVSRAKPKQSRQQFILVIRQNYIIHYADVWF